MPLWVCSTPPKPLRLAAHEIPACATASHAAGFISGAGFQEAGIPQSGDASCAILLKQLLHLLMQQCAVRALCPTWARLEVCLSAVGAGVPHSCIISNVSFLGGELPP